LRRKSSGLRKIGGISGYDRFDVPIQQLEATGGAYGLGPVFLLVAAYDRLGQTKRAIGVLQKLVADLETAHVPPFVLIVLCELYPALDDWDEIIHVVGHFQITNIDDATLILRTYQALAMANSGLDEAALQTFKDCLRSSGRDPGLLRTARYNRAQVYLKTGKKALARRDLSRVFSEDPTYRDTDQLLRGLG
jgi:tetratricopeptide (TPR) repeat protein